MRTSLTKMLSEWVFPWLIFFIGIWYFGIRILGNNLEFIPGDLGDSRFINFLLEHNYQWIIGKVDSFWDAGFMFPYPGTIAISDNMLGTAPIYSVFRLFGFNQETAYQLWWLSMSALNYWVTYLVVKKWMGRTDLAIIAAYVFAFSIFNNYQLNYMQMIVRFMVPAAIYFAYKLVDTASVKYLLYLSLAIIIQMYSVIYTGFFLLYFTVGFILVYAIVSKRKMFFKLLFTKQNWKKTVAVLFVSLVLLLVLFIPYLQYSGLGHLSYNSIKMNLPVWNAFLLPHKSSIPWGWMHDVLLPNTPKWWLQSVFIGIVPLLVIISTPFVIGLWKFKKLKFSALTITLAIVVLGITLLFLRLENGMSLYAFVFHLPGLSNIRVMHRFMHVEMFFILMLLLMFLRNKPKSWALVLLVLLIADNTFNAEDIGKIPKQEIVERRESVIEEVNQLKKPNHKAFAIIDTTQKHFITHLDAMSANFYVGLPTVNGYSSSCPGGFGEFFAFANREGLDLWMEKNSMKLEEILVIEK